MKKFLVFLMICGVFLSTGIWRYNTDAQETDSSSRVIEIEIGNVPAAPAAPQKAAAKKAKKSWETQGNTDIDPNTDFLGTTDNADLVIKTNNIEAMRVDTFGNVGIGITTPGARLDVVGGLIRGDSGLTISSGLISLPAGSIVNSVLANSSLTFFAGSGLIGGGSVSLGGVASFDIGGGPGINVGADSISVNFGSTVDTAAEGDTPFFINTIGNLIGGGNGTAGSGLTLTLDTTPNPIFSTSVTTPLLTHTGPLTLQTTGVGNDLIFATSGLERLRILAANGRVGIGILNPLHQLDVVGTIRSSLGGFVFPDGTTQTTAITSVDDADADATNELQTLSQSGNQVTLSNGGGTVTFSDDPTDELNLDLTLSGTNLQITDNGGTLSTDLSSLIPDADADPANELQTLSQSGSQVTLSNGGGTVTIDDADANATNELQTLTQTWQSGDTLQRRGHSQHRRRRC